MYFLFQVNFLLKYYFRKEDLGIYLGHPKPFFRIFKDFFRFVVFFKL